MFLYLGVAALLFLFALFPMPFSADYDGFSNSAEKDLGFVWGLPLDGEDMFDVPMRLTVPATSPPSDPWSTSLSTCSTRGLRHGFHGQ